MTLPSKRPGARLAGGYFGLVPGCAPEGAAPPARASLPPPGRGGSRPASGRPGRRIVAARTLAEARALLARGPTPDLAIVDRMLPDGSGLVFCRELRAGHPALPLVVLTGYAPHPDEPVAADLVLTKPFSAADVRFAVARLRARRPKTQGGSSRPGAVG